MDVVLTDAHRDHHCLELDSATLIPSWEGPDRFDRIVEALDGAGYRDRHQPDPLDRRLVEAVHDVDYVRFLESVWDRWVESEKEAPAAMGFGWPGRRLRSVRPDDVVGQLGYYSFAADCSVVAGTWQAAAGAAATAQTAARLLADGVPNVFALCRPPGHHASRDQFGGYCYLNNAAVAAQALLDGGLSGRDVERVAILDVDYHHGNGTQDIFYERDDVAFCSIHADPLEEFPWFLGHGDETGEERGAGYTLNLPLPRGTAFDVWSDALERALAWLAGLGCDALVVSLGVDTYHDDPISSFELSTADYPGVGRRIAGLGLPTVIVMEGGYATDALGANVVGFLDGFASGS